MLMMAVMFYCVSLKLVIRTFFECFRYGGHAGYGGYVSLRQHETGAVHSSDSCQGKQWVFSVCVCVCVCVCVRACMHACVCVHVHAYM